MAPRPEQVLCLTVCYIAWQQFSEISVSDSDNPSLVLCLKFNFDLCLSVRLHVRGHTDEEILQLFLRIWITPLFWSAFLTLFLNSCSDFFRKHSL